MCPPEHTALSRFFDHGQVYVDDDGVSGQSW
jgi:hypothetical protein